MHDVMNPQQLATLTATLNDFCKTAAIEPGTSEFEEASYLVMSLYCQGASTAETLTAAVENRLLRESNGLFLSSTRPINGPCNVSVKRFSSKAGPQARAGHDAGLAGLMPHRIKRMPVQVLRIIRVKDIATQFDQPAPFEHRSAGCLLHGGSHRAGQLRIQRGWPVHPLAVSNVATTPEALAAATAAHDRTGPPKPS